MRAHYLLRFDDICPGMNWGNWNRVEDVLVENKIKPLLAVVPDNRDPALDVGPPDASFWERVREWQVRGWTVAMHGWQHRFVSTDSGILRVNRYSEFAGLPRAEQQLKVRSGREVFDRKGIASSVWIAPAHSFDAVTLDLLPEHGFRYISDGFHLLPHVDKFGLTWIPQQLWSFRSRPFGVWTICFHINSWSARHIEAFEGSVKLYRNWISDFETIVNRYGRREHSVIDSASASLYRGLSSVNAGMKHLAAPLRAGGHAI